MLNYYANATGFPSSLDIAFAEVSCIDGKGMKELKHKMKDLVDKYTMQYDTAHQVYHVPYFSAKVKGQKIMGGYVPSYYLVIC